MGKSPTWLIERNVFDDGNPQRIAEIAKARGIRCVQVEYVSIDGDEQNLKPSKPVPLSDDELVFVYGSMNLCCWLLRNHKWPKLAWYDFDRLQCQNYYRHWREYLLQQDYVVLPLVEVVQRRASLFKTIGDGGRIFIRPDDNAKSFAGGVVHEADFDAWWKRANFYGPSPDALAVVARPQAIRSEWRLIVANRRVVTGSTYRVDGIESTSPEFPSEAAHFAEVVASGDFEPHPIYVMDVCETASGYRVVEIGSICCASLYACDLQKIVKAVSEAVTAAAIE